jgi:hypothetical protein
MDLSSSPTWINYVISSVPILASGFIYLVVRPLTQKIDDLGKHMAALEMKVDDHEDQDLLKFDSVNAMMEQRISALREEISAGHRADMKELSENIRTLSNRIDNVLNGISGIQGVLRNRRSTDN